MRGRRASSGCAQAGAVAGSRDVTIASGGRERSFRLVVPESALRGVAAPLVVLFHGSNGDGAKEIAVTGLDVKAQQEGFVLAAGNGTQRSWNSGFCRDPDGGACVTDVDDVQFARDLVRAVQGELCIDTARVSATGFSKGAAMVFRLACEASDLFTAFAPVAGALLDPACAPARPRPILIVNAAADAVVPLAAGEHSFRQLLALDGCDDTRDTGSPAAGATCETAPGCADGATTTFCVVEGGHRWPGGATDPTFPFAATDAVSDFFAQDPH